MAPMPPGAFPATLELGLGSDVDFIRAATPADPNREQARLLRGDPGAIEALGEELQLSGRDFTTAYEQSTDAQRGIGGAFDNDGAPVYSAAVHRRWLPANFSELGELTRRAGIRFTDLAGHLRTAVDAANTADAAMVEAFRGTRNRWAEIVEAATGPDGLIPQTEVAGVLADRASMMTQMQGHADTAGRRIDRARTAYEGELMVVRNAVSDMGFVPAPQAQPVDPNAAARTEGADDAARISDALQGPPSAGTLSAIDAATTRLRMLQDKLASGQALDPVDRAYVGALVDTLGAGKLGALGGHIQDALGSAGLTGAPARTRYEEMIAPFGTTITATGSGTVLDPGTAVPRAAGYADLPAAARALIETRPGVRDHTGLLYPNDEFATGVGVADDPANPGRDLFGAGVAGMAGYTTITDMLDQSRVAPSADVAQHVINGAVQVRQDLNTAEANARNELTTRGVGTPDQFAALADTIDASAAETALSVGARSVEGSSAALNDPARLPALMGLNWETGEGAAAVIAAGTERDPKLGGGTQAQSDAALAVFQEAGRDPIGYAGRPAVGAAAEIPGRMTDQVHDAVINVGVQYLDAFAGPDARGSQGLSRSVSDAVDVLGVPVGSTPQLRIQDKIDFLHFVAADSGAAETFWEAGKLANRSELVHALNDGSTDHVQTALDRAGRFDGLMRGAVLDQHALLAQTDDTAAALRNATLEARVEQGVLNTVAVAGKEVVGALPPVAAAKAVTAPLLSLLTEMSKGAIAVDTIPVAIPTGDAATLTARDVQIDNSLTPLRQTALLASALDEVGAFPAGQQPPILTADSYGPEGQEGPDGIVDEVGASAANTELSATAVSQALDRWAAEHGDRRPDPSAYYIADDSTKTEGTTTRRQDSVWNTDADSWQYGPDPAGRVPFYEP